LPRLLYWTTGKTACQSSSPSTSMESHQVRPSFATTKTEFLAVVGFCSCHTDDCELLAQWINTEKRGRTELPEHSTA
jgi:hypothetical protein